MIAKIFRYPYMAYRLSISKSKYGDVFINLGKVLIMFIAKRKCTPIWELT